LDENGATRGENANDTLIGTIRRRTIQEKAKPADIFECMIYQGGLE
jgi:hypothetical protein